MNLLIIQTAFLGDVVLAIPLIQAAKRHLKAQISVVCIPSTADILAGRPDIDEILITIAEKSALEGAINVQLRVTDDGPSIFEINPRFSSTVMMRHLIGFSDLVWMIEARKGLSLPPFDAPVG